ncbi:Lsr2 family protein [Pseudoclavibacter sp. Z016]|uniref:histone-like nucleoid-structuring protein Lsr2 n=1 Tax=Pseudoclavibacter sp. Z016 TaxID=2080581 RepID=UPI000CE89CDD|nr:Lsr2 family protein [Pseudoclavibacter sp. Z016]PPF72625.1 hypothetical protein C5B99_17450 [Pseudoclavibacter sp. Z016]
MAKKVIYQLTDDLDQSTIPDGEGETVTFGLDGTAYEIDLTDTHATKLRSVLNRYVEAARKTSGKSGSAKKASGPKRDLNAIREWARSNGHNVADRGRISADVVDAYDAAN